MLHLLGYPTKYLSKTAHHTGTRTQALHLPTSQHKIHQIEQYPHLLINAVQIARVKCRSVQHSNAPVSTERRRVRRLEEHGGTSSEGSDTKAGHGHGGA